MGYNFSVDIYADVDTLWAAGWTKQGTPFFHSTPRIGI